jgi:hypothetical protein
MPHPAKRSPRRHQPLLIVPTHAAADVSLFDESYADSFSGGVNQDCPGNRVSGCAGQRYAGASIGLRSAASGCRVCTSIAHGYAGFRCGLNVGSGTGAHAQLCYTCVQYQRQGDPCVYVR